MPVRWRSLMKPSSITATMQGRSLVDLAAPPPSRSTAARDYPAPQPRLVDCSASCPTV